MMTETSKIVIRSSRNAPVGQGDFVFTKDMVRMPATSETLRQYRSNAWDTFISTPFPTARQEAWRRTDISKLSPADYVFPSPKEVAAKVPQGLLDLYPKSDFGGQIILSSAQTDGFIDDDIASQGVIFTDLRTAEKEHPELLEKVIGHVVKPTESKFSALSAALAQNGAFLYVPRGVEVKKPLFSLYWGSGSKTAHITHLVILLEEGASATYIHEYNSSNESGTSFHAGIVEIIVSDNAQLKFAEHQAWGNHVWNFTHERAHVARGGRLDWTQGSTGSYLTKNFTDVDLVGEGSSGYMSGFYFTDQHQHMDLDTQQNHLAPHTTSNLLFKGVLLDESRAVWQGMIYVDPKAIKTDGYQLNRNLILSEKARADTLPGLEILADDVRCSHGATVSKLDAEQLFYLLSRGIPQDEAEHLVIEGFIEPIIDTIPLESARQRLKKVILQKMSKI